jgi:hypothetical protein
MTEDINLMVKAVDGLRKVSEVKVQYNIKYFLGCDIVELPGETRLYQKIIVNKFIEGSDFIGNDKDTGTA